MNAQWADFDREEDGSVRNWLTFFSSTWKTKPMFVEQFREGTLCMQKWIEYVQCLPFNLLKLIYFGMVCFHPLI